MTVGNLVALRQRRMVRLLAWSSVAQAGYILAPLGALRWPPGAPRRGRAASRPPSAYAVFYVVLELAAFAAVVALRRRGADGGDARRLPRARPAAARGWRRRSVLALAGLAGLPPGLAGLFAKVTVVRALLGGGAAWLAVVVALNAVIGLAYYLRVAAALFAARRPPGRRGRPPRRRRVGRGRGRRSRPWCWRSADAGRRRSLGVRRRSWCVDAGRPLTAASRARSSALTGAAPSVVQRTHSACAG